MLLNGESFSFARRSVPDRDSGGGLCSGVNALNATELDA